MHHQSAIQLMLNLRARNQEVRVKSVSTVDADCGKPRSRMDWSWTLLSSATSPPVAVVIGVKVG
jgi:uncharacterized protein (DUF305 family)